MFARRGRDVVLVARSADELARSHPGLKNR